MLFACVVSSNAQTLTFSAAGSSALYLELGQAATQGPISADCIWSYGKGAVQALDPSTAVDAGQVWIEWTKGTGTCTAPSSTAEVFVYLQTDSVVGDRCLFNGCVLEAGSSGNPTNLANADLITGTKGTQITNVPASIWNVINGKAVNAAGTDIRPEDAEFATTRAITACGTTVGTFQPLAVSSSQYKGLGYSSYTSGGTDDQIISYYSTSTFNVVKFTLPANFYVQPVGADPIVVAVNSTDPSGTGFNNPNITNLTKSTLALYLDGSIGSTSDALTPGTTGTAAATTVLIREPLSGTYNTMEYNVPNTFTLQTSQDVGAEQPASQKNCSGTSPLTNPLHIENSNYGSYRNRAIGTSQEIAEIFANNDALGYSFWGVSNFAAAPSTAKYLTVDGVDPIQSTYTGGVIPTTSSELANVNFAHVADGSYPIWSLLRLVTLTSSQQGTLKTLAQAAANFSTSSHPDFLPYFKPSTENYAQNIFVERSHFDPPGIGFTKAPVNGVCGVKTEVGGDVGGVVIPCAVDTDYTTTTGGTEYVNHRN